MNSFSIIYNLEIAFEIKGYPDHVIVKGGDIYNRKTGRKLKKTVIGYTKGVWFGKDFLTKKKIDLLLKKPSKEYCPF